MRNAVVIICLALVSAGAAVASPGEATKKAAWTVSKAERQVLSGATVRLVTEDRAALEEELRRGMVLNQALAAEAAVTGYGLGELGGSVYLDRAYAYSLALSKVRRGLAVDVADCTGWGRAVAGRFNGFRCRVISESVEIPSPEPEPNTSQTGLILVEEVPRSIGPIEAVLDVRVTGSSSFSYKAL